ncbi:MAG TPA: hypothetical protein QF564_11350 [Pirellulaceae bacterium]|nr:hypothetical protein [Pirellulaceae bacterium]
MNIVDGHNAGMFQVRGDAGFFNERKTRAEERLQLLEKVYASFLLKFCLEGCELDVPTEHLKVVLFADKRDYLDFGRVLKNPSLSKASGFYAMKENVAVFFDHGTDEDYKTLARLSKKLQATKDQAIKRRIRGIKEFARFANTLQLLIQVSRENSDIEWRAYMRSLRTDLERVLDER